MKNGFSLRAVLCPLLSCLLLVLPVASARSENSTPLRVLVIGNSFSVDAVEQELYPMARAAGLDLCIGSLYIGGCSLEQHARNMQQHLPAYSFRLIADGRRLVTDSLTLNAALRAQPWDVVTMQQVSDLSGDYSSYFPWLSVLIDSVLAVHPSARLAWHATWAYDADAAHPGFARYGGDQQRMADSINSCARSVMAEYPFRLLIPVTEAVQAARRTRLGPTLTRDGYHLRYDYGRYLAACVWLEALTGVRPRATRYAIPWYGSQYEPVLLTKKEVRRLRSALTERRCRRAAHKVFQH